MNKKLHLLRCIVNSNHSLSEELYNAEVYIKENKISCPIVYVEDIVIKQWFIYLYKNKEWILLDKGELIDE